MREYFVVGDPVAQGRARALVRPGAKFAVFYDPKESKDWKKVIADQVSAQSPVKVVGPVNLELVFFMPIPQYIGKMKDYQHHVKKPDLDNLTKAVKDALKGICWADDSQVVRMVCEKVYSYSEGPGVRIDIGGVK